MPFINGKPKNMKILIVDDTRLMLRILVKLLHQHGFETSEAMSGEEALSQLSTDPDIGAVITDLDMEPINGVELFRATQALFESSEFNSQSAPPFILLTAHSRNPKEQFRMSDEMEFASRAFDAVLKKPIVEEELLSALNRLEQAAFFTETSV